jgi:putative methionine-R-sulfoxide reductase with GAF domain
MEEREDEKLRLCEEAVARLADALPGREVACLLPSGDDLLRHVAHRGKLRLIYEVPRDLGGVVWRAFDERQVQVVHDVGSDPDYIASDDSIRAEVVAPVAVGQQVVAVLDVESPTPLSDGDPALVEREAERLAAQFEPLVRGASQ